MILSLEAQRLGFPGLIMCLFSFLAGLPHGRTWAGNAQGAPLGIMSDESISGSDPDLDPDLEQEDMEEEEEEDEEEAMEEDNDGDDEEDLLDESGKWMGLWISAYICYTKLALLILVSDTLVGCIRVRICPVLGREKCLCGCLV